MLKLEQKLGSPTYVCNGATIPCIPTTARRGTEIAMGGHLATVDLTLLVRVNALPTGVTVDSTVITVDSTSTTVDSSQNRPVSGRKITHANKQYRVISIGTAPGGSHLEVDLEDVNR